MKKAKSNSVIIAGGNGLIGRKLSAFLVKNGYSVSILSRHPERIKEYKAYYWKPSKNEIDPEALKNQDVIINLAGASVASNLWTNKYKTKIINSRLLSLKVLKKGLIESGATPTKIISASAIGYYGDRPNEILYENSFPGEGFLADTCIQWELAADKLNLNTIKVRIGLVLTDQGGVLSKFSLPAKLGLNIILGNGHQMVSWIHMDDLVRALHFIIEQNEPEKVYNLVGENPLSLQRFQESIYKQISKRNITIKIPKPFVKTLIGDMSELFLFNQAVHPINLIKRGFEFDYISAESAIKNLIDK